MALKSTNKVETNLYEIEFDVDKATFDSAVEKVYRKEVKKINKPRKETPEEEPLPYVDYFREMELKIQSHLGRRALINGKGRKKSITLFYEDNEDLDELLKVICGEDFLEE